MIFYCKAGVRAQTAVDLARSQGYKLCVVPPRFLFLASLLPSVAR